MNQITRKFTQKFSAHEIARGSTIVTQTIDLGSGESKTDCLFMLDGVAVTLTLSEILAALASVPKLSLLHTRNRVNLANAGFMPTVYEVEIVPLKIEAFPPKDDDGEWTIRVGQKDFPIFKATRLLQQMESVARSAEATAKSLVESMNKD